jgi:hypothetical protein
MDGVNMIKPRIAIASAAILAFLAPTPTFSQDYRVLRYGNTSGWYYDGRDDGRDFSTNGLFPGNFASNPSHAWIGADGLFGSNPWHSATAYPSQAIVGSTGVYCTHRYRSYDPASGTFLGKDGVRHRC